MTSSTSKKKGRLFLIPITIGTKNVDRYMPRENIEIIKSVKTYVVENARTARQFIRSILPDLDISTLNIYEADKHKGYDYPKEKVLARLNCGEDIGLMSEAGCPAVADPGHRVVADCHQANIKIEPLVGPSSILLSIMASGFSGQCFTFHGYLPYDQTKRKRMLLNWQKSCQQNGETHVFIEAPYRNDKLIRELIEVLSPSQRLCIAVDLTTPNEEIICRTITNWKLKMDKGATYQKRPAIFLIGKYIQCD